MEIDLKDEKAWALFKEGRTKGIFQLETQLGKCWAKRVGPRTIEELADVISILRPACLKSLLEDGKSITQHYVERKHGREKPDTIHSSLDSILAKTQGLILFQESCMLISQKLAGFDLKEADDLRKSIGHKDAKKMAEVKVKFLEGCKKMGVVEDDIASKVFEWIEKSARYSFNKCLDPQTQVYTKNGIRLLNNLVVGDFVLAPKNEMQDEFVEVVDIIHNGEREIYKVNLNYETSIKCTLDHKFLCMDGTTRPVKEIIEGDFTVLLTYGRRSRITSIEKVGLKPTMDITVSSDMHVFYGDNIAVQNSHAVSYALTSYNMAWYKANFPREFFISCLYFAHEKLDPHQEIYELVAEAKLFNIDIKIPTLCKFSKKFKWIDNAIYFGIKDIKSMVGVSGDKVYDLIKQTEIDLGKCAGEFTWMDVLVYLSPHINSTAFKTLTSVGFFSTKTTLISRNKAIYQYLIFKDLTATELKWVTENYGRKKWASLKDCFIDLAPTKKEGGGTSKADRKQKIIDEIYFIDNPPYSLDDDPSWIIDQEVKFLGCPISLSRVDAVDTSSSNASCKDILNGKTGKEICIVANISRYATYKCKKGKSKGELMAFLTLEDDSCSIDNVVIFPQVRKEYEFLLYEGNNLLFCGEVEKGPKGGSFVVQKIHEVI